MKKGIFFIFLLFCLTLQSQTRPKIGLVLSGGGAKGTAHVGALKIIEETGIPIDYIVGTSMGSIVGSLYSIGYSPAELEDILMKQDWKQLLSDQSKREDMTLKSKEQSDKYILSLPFSQKPQNLFEGGVLRGRNIGHMLWELTEGYHDSIDFRKMPIPFACVSQDVATGKEIVHTSGVLPIAVRASMSIPGVFAPVVLGNRVLIDGGIVNNYPVDVARQMGADIIIGVDVQEDLKKPEELEKDMFGLLLQILDLQGKHKWEENIKNTDIYIKVNVKGYSSASFKTEAIDTLIRRGEQAARMKWQQLEALSKKIHKDTVPKKKGNISLGLFAQNEKKKHEQYKHLLIGDAPKNSLNLGARYDIEEVAAILLNSQFQFKNIPRHSFALTARLGKRLAIRADYAFHLLKEWNLATAYEFQLNDFNIYSKGTRICDMNFNRHDVKVNVGRSWKKIMLHLGGEFVHYNYGDVLFQTENHFLKKTIDQETYVKLGARCSFNNMDHTYFPTHGHGFSAYYEYVIPTDKSDPFHITSIHWKGAFSLNSHFTIDTWAAGRYITSNHSVSEANTIGGQEAGKYFEQQLPFYGINHFEIANRALVNCGFELRQRIGKNHYVSAIGNMGLSSDSWLKFFKNCFGQDETKGYYLIGGALKYDWKTIIGPIGATLHYSNRSKKVGVYIRAGYNF